MPFPPEAPQRVREKVASGALPLTPPIKMWAGFGSGARCSGCDQTITSSQAEYELEVPGGRTFVMHLGCASLLEAERRERGEEGGGSTG